MQNFTCTKCGSNKLQIEDDHYICDYCGATIFKPTTMPKKRLAFIIVALSLLLIGAVMVYNLLYSVKSDIQEIKTQQTQTTDEVHGTQRKQAKNTTSDSTEENPFADMVLKVESSYQDKNSGNRLEKTLEAYQDYEKNKALFISIASNGENAIGYAYAAKSIQEAEQQAQKICEQERIKNSLKESCIPYDINGKVSRLLIGL